MGINMVFRAIANLIPWGGVSFTVSNNHYPQYRVVQLEFNHLPPLLLTEAGQCLTGHSARQSVSQQLYGFTSRLAT